MKDLLLKLLAGLGVEIPADKKAEFDKRAAEIEKELQPTPPVPPVPPVPGNESAVVTELRNEVAGLKQMLKDLTGALGDEKNTREAAAKRAAEEAAAENKKKAAAAVEQAFAAGKFNQADKEKWLKRAEANLSDTEDILNAMPPAKGFVPPAKKNDGKPGNPPAYTPATPLERVNNIDLLNKVAGYAQPVDTN